MANRLCKLTALGCCAAILGCLPSVAPPVPLSDESIERSAIEFDSPASAQSQAEVSLDPGLPNYEPVDQLSGRITSVGSDTMNNLVQLWVEGFMKFYPEVEFEVEGKGSSTAMPALIAGAANIGPMSRDPKQGEIDDFQTKFGYPPTPIASAIDMLAIYVNKENPLPAISLPQVDAIFSKTRRLGYPQPVNTWGELGLIGPWADRAISLYGRNSASGTYGYFKDHALGGGDFRDAVKEQPGSSSVVQAVGSDLGAIGYSGSGYQTSDVRAVPVSDEVDEPAIPAEAEFAYDGTYPLARHLWLTVNYRPESQLDPLTREFIKFVLSRQGQQRVVEDGYLPLPAATAKQALQSIGITSGE